MEHFKGEKTLFPKLEDNKKYDNKNSSVYLQSVVMGIHEQLRYLKSAPSVQMRHIPGDLAGLRDKLEKESWHERMSEMRAKKEKV